MDPISDRRAPGVRVRRSRRDRGAAAVEMAIILPLLLILIGGIVDLSRYMFTKAIVTNAAREGARSMAVGYTQTQSRALVTSALAGGVAVATPVIALSGATSTGTDGNPACPATTPVVTDTVSVTVTATGFTYVFLGPVSAMVGGSGLVAPQPSGTSLMRCGG